MKSVITYQSKRYSFVKYFVIASIVHVVLAELLIVSEFSPRSVANSTNKGIDSGTSIEELQNKLHTLQSLYNDIAESRNEYIDNYRQFERHMYDSLPGLLLQHEQLLKRYHKNSIDELIRCRQAIANSHGAWRKFQRNENSFLMRQSHLDIVAKTASEAYNHINLALSHQLSFKKELGEFRTLSHWKNSDSVLRKLNQFEAIGDSLPVTLQNAKDTLDHFLQLSTDFSDIYSHDSSQYEFSSEYSLLKSFVADSAYSHLPRQAIELLLKRGKELDSLLSPLQRFTSRLECKNLPAFELPTDTTFVSSHSFDSLIDYSLRLRMRIDSMYLDARAAQNAQNNGIPYIRERQRIDSIPSDYDRNSDEKRPQEYIVTPEIFESFCEIVRNQYHGIPSDTSGEQTDTILYVSRQQADTLDVKLTISIDSLMQMAQMMSSVKDTIFMTKPPIRFKDTSTIPISIQDSDLVKLQIAFPLKERFNDPLKNLQKNNNYPGQNQLVFRLFPQVNMVSGGKCYGSNPVLFYVPIKTGSNHNLSNIPHDGNRERSLRLIDNAIERAYTMREKLKSTSVTESVATGIHRFSRAASANKTGIAPLSRLSKQNIIERALPIGPHKVRHSDWNLPELKNQSQPPSIMNFYDKSGIVLSDNGTPVEWFFVPQWYTLGPFHNDDRCNIVKAFEPEYGIDLEAVYRGSGNRPITWEYIHSSNCAIIPPGMQEYSVFYAWTRLKSDREQQVTFAFGGDDRMDVWVNGEPVWNSSNNLKSWGEGEGFVPVLLRIGENTVTVRLENAWGPSAFSVIIGWHPN